MFSLKEEIFLDSTDTRKILSLLFQEIRQSKIILNLENNFCL